MPTTGSPTELWLDQYEGGWQTVLPGGGFPSQYGDVQLGLHAEVNTVPWDSLVVEDTPDKVSLKCWVRTVRTPFYFEKTMTLNRDEAVLKTDEILINEGEETAHAVWGEHIAIGEPFLNENCVIDLPGGTIITHPERFHSDNKLKPGFEGPWPLVEGEDFFVGYSPERVNPGDKKHDLKRINKILAYPHTYLKKELIKLYSLISKKIIFSNNIKEAETAKVIENIQRDVNIGLITNASDFGNLSAARRSPQAVMGNGSRAVVVAGNAPTAATDIMEYFTVGILGNATDFGEFVAASARGGDSGFSGD